MKMLHVTLDYGPAFGLLDLRVSGKAGRARRLPSGRDSKPQRFPRLSRSFALPERSPTWDSDKLPGAVVSQPRRVVALLLSLCCTLFAGCQGGDPQPVPVSGIVRYNGKPLDHGEVIFIPDDTEHGRSGRGQIGEDGTYALMTFAPKDGVLPGNYSVAVSCYAKGEKLGEPGVPERYLDPKKSGLRAKVGYSATVVDFEVEGEIESTGSMMGRN